MNTSRTKFVGLFLILGFAFLFGTTAILNQPPESFVGSESQAAWQSVVSTVLSPIKIVLIGPMLPFINFLHRDPDTPPPFFLAMFAVYWSVLALCLHFFLRRKQKQPVAGKPAATNI
jgi:FtsH-binding integral membrane protein